MAFSESEQSKNGAGKMVPLYAARVRDLGPDDVAVFKCGACGHTAERPSCRARSCGQAPHAPPPSTSPGTASPPPPPIAMPCGRRSAPNASEQDFWGKHAVGGGNQKGIQAIRQAPGTSEASSANERPWRCDCLRQETLQNRQRH